LGFAIGKDVIMKNRIIIMIVLVILVISCNNIPSLLESKVTVITREVTRIISEEIYIIKSLTPSSTPTKKLTATFTITPTLSCFDTAISQRELNDCAWLLAEDKKEKLHQLVEKIAYKFTYNPKKKEAFLQYEAEWEELAENECWTWWGSLDDSGWYEKGSMAQMEVGLCVGKKYEERIEEIKFLLK
jgi:hypothetical protein